VIARTVVAAPQWYRAVQLGELRRNEPHAWIVDALLDVIHGVKREWWRTDAWDRRYFVQLIESAARGLSGDFTRMVLGLDGQSEQWVVERSAGVAASLRNLKRELIAPRVESADLIAKTLRKYVIRLATGNLRQLPWLAPPPPPRPVSFRGRMWRAVRLTIVAALPISALLVLNLTVGIPAAAEPGCWLCQLHGLWFQFSLSLILSCGRS
jgi:hypothetical protein